MKFIVVLWCLLSSGHLATKAACPNPPARELELEKSLLEGMGELMAEAVKLFLEGEEELEDTLSSLELPQDCGKRFVRPGGGRVAGGRQAKVGEFPSYMRLDILRSAGGSIKPLICGGTLISERHVLTAAHCLRRDSAILSVTAVATTHQSKWITGVDLDDHWERFEAAKWCLEPRYNSTSSSESGLHLYDLALVKLARPVKFNSLTQPACLPATPSAGQRGRLEAVGLGMDFYAGARRAKNFTHPTRLQALPVKWAPCDQRDRHPTKVCFEPSDPNHMGGTCFGDSGGPIYGLEEERMVVVGATSYGLFKVCQAGTPAMSVNSDIYALRQQVAQLLADCA